MCAQPFSLHEPRTAEQLRADLLTMLRRDALKRGEFVLSSGRRSSFYLDGRIITMTPEGAYLAGLVILEMIRGTGIAALGGPTLGADPIVGAVAALSHLRGIPLRTFIVRKAAKAHGTQQQVEGPALRRGDEVVLVDDVATSGKSLLEAKQVMDGLGVSARRAIVIVDRGEGARESLRSAGCALESVFGLADLGV